MTVTESDGDRAAGDRPWPPAALDGVALGVLLFFFILVTVGGFAAARWRRAESLHSLDEWGLGGRSFGTVITWFLLGGDLYTAYTFIAVPAAMFATGAVSGFFAVAYTILVYPIVFVFMPRMWSIAHSKGYVTAADFIRGRFDSRGLALAVAITGIIATMPYIALQLVGIQAVLDTIGIGGQGNAFVRDLPLLVAFAVLAAYTYSSGLRAPALIAFVKDSLVYLVIAVAIVYVGVHVGFHHLFQSAQTKMATKNQDRSGDHREDASPKWGVLYCRSQQQGEQESLINRCRNTQQRASREHFETRCAKQIEILSLCINKCQSSHDRHHS